jgi:hypothetical protein
MALTRKDALATILTALAVFVFVATHEAWNVWLVGSSRHWAAGAIALLGALTCGLGSPADKMRTSGGMDAATRLLSLIGVLALVLAVWAIWSGSLTPLSLLVVCIVLLWAGATLRHGWHPTHRHVPTYKRFCGCAARLVTVGGRAIRGEE